MKKGLVILHSAKRMMALIIGSIILIVGLGISVYALEVVDWSQCPYCGSEAELFDNYTMRCPVCLYSCDSWNCLSGQSIRSATNSPYTYFSDYLQHFNEGPWEKISSNRLKHVLNNHTIS